MKKKMYGLFELEDDTANAIIKIDGEPVGTGVCEYTLNHKAGELPVVDIKADVGVSGKKKFIIRVFYAMKKMQYIVLNVDFY